tara:strand:- start:9871 stop:10146 length:276 start_codon:yes stop_codon:yes gene_type:complete
MSKLFFEIGNFSCYLPEMAKIDKETFCKTYGRNVNRNISTVWDIMQERIKELGLNEDTEINIEPRKENKKSKRKKSDDFSIQQSGVQETDN